MREYQDCSRRDWATVKICNGENLIEEVMEIVDEAELPHCFLINVNPLKENQHLKPEKIQEIFGVVHGKNDALSSLFLNSTI